MIVAVVGMVVLACLPATLDQAKRISRAPHWLLLATLKRHHRMRQPATFQVVVDPARAGQRRHALREDRVVPS